VVVVNVKLATPQDIQSLIQFAIKVKKEKKLEEHIELNTVDFGFWITECILSAGIYVFVVQDNKGICGFIVLNEISYPWNSSIKYGADLLFVAQKGGPKLIRTAKKLAKTKGWQRLLLTTTTNNERSDRFLNHVADKIGGVYELKV
jgi:hypothetical protein